jgi:hypothetical protein
MVNNGWPVWLSSIHRQQSSRNIRNAGARHADESRENDGEDEAIQPIHESAMARNEMAGVLDIEPALQGRFKQIADLG